MFFGFGSFQALRSLALPFLLSFVLTKEFYERLRLLLDTSSYLTTCLEAPMGSLGIGRNGLGFIGFLFCLVFIWLAITVFLCFVDVLL